MTKYVVAVRPLEGTKARQMTDADIDQGPSTQIMITVKPKLARRLQQEADDIGLPVATVARMLVQQRLKEIDGSLAHRIEESRRRRAGQD